jgi:hypothetical protein
MCLVKVYGGFAVAFMLMGIVFSYINFHIKHVMLWWALPLLALANYALAVVYHYRRPRGN